jgi:AraC family transcriptional regulator, transcriptional activator of pobA
VTASEVGSSRTIFVLEQTRALRPRGDAGPVFAFAPGAHPIGMLRLTGDDMPPGPPTPGRPHSHDFVVLAYFERPGGCFRVHEERWPVETGDLVVISPGEVIAYEPDPDAAVDARGWGVFFLPDALGSDGSGVRLSWRAHPLLFPFVGGAAGAIRRLRVSPAERTAWAARMEALNEELRRRDDGHHEAVRAHLTLLLVAVARLADATVTEVRVGDDPLLARVFNIIEKRYTEAISLADVARSLNLTPGYLTTAVRQRTGRTVLEWITERRMTEARRLLAQTDLPVAEVGRRVGYTDPAYFTRSFRRAHQITPSGWRRSAPT